MLEMLGNIYNYDDIKSMQFYKSTLYSFVTRFVSMILYLDSNVLFAISYVLML